jgi:uncharacterized protein Veg
MILWLSSEAKNQQKRINDMIINNLSIFIIKIRKPDAGKESASTFKYQDICTYYG